MKAQVTEALKNLVKSGKVEAFRIYKKGEASRMYPVDMVFCASGTHTLDTVDEWYRAENNLIHNEVVYVQKAKRI